MDTAKTTAREPRQSGGGGGGGEESRGWRTWRWWRRRAEQEAVKEEDERDESPPPDVAGCLRTRVAGWPGVSRASVTIRPATGRLYRYAKACPGTKQMQQMIPGTVSASCGRQALHRPSLKGGTGASLRQGTGEKRRRRTPGQAPIGALRRMLGACEQRAAVSWVHVSHMPSIQEATATLW